MQISHSHPFLNFQTPPGNNPEGGVDFRNFRRTLNRVAHTVYCLTLHPLHLKPHSVVLHERLWVLKGLNSYVVLNTRHSSWSVRQIFDRPRKNDGDSFGKFQTKGDVLRQSSGCQRQVIRGA